MHRGSYGVEKGLLLHLYFVGQRPRN